MPANSTQNMTDSQTEAEGTHHHSEPESAHIGRNALILALTDASQPGSLPSHDVQPCIIMPYTDYIGACYISMDSLCTLILTIVLIKNFGVRLKWLATTLSTRLPEQIQTSPKAITR